MNIFFQVEQAAQINPNNSKTITWHGKYHRKRTNIIVSVTVNLYLEMQLPKDLFLSTLVKAKHTFLKAVIQGHISICTSNLYSQEDEGLPYHCQGFFLKAAVQNISE